MPRKRTEKNQQLKHPVTAAPFLDPPPGAIFTLPRCIGRSDGKLDIIKAYLNVQEQQVSSGQWARLAEVHRQADRQHALGGSETLGPSAAFLLRSIQAAVPWASVRQDYPEAVPRPLPKPDGRAVILVPARGDYGRALATWDPATPTVYVPDSTLHPGNIGARGAADPHAARTDIERVDGTPGAGSAVPPRAMGGPARGRVDGGRCNGGLRGRSRPATLGATIELNRAV